MKPSIGVTRTVSALAVVAALALALSACAPPTKLVPTAKPSGQHSSTGSSPTATPTPTQAADPGVRVPLTCASLFTDSTVAGYIDTPVKYHIDETTPAVDIVDIVARQYGSLICLWGGDGRTDGGYDENLTVEVTPDAASGFTANLNGFKTETDNPVVNTAGDQSVYGCGVQGELQCTGNMLVGSYWVTVTLQDITSASTSQATADSRIQQALSAVATKLKNTVSLPAWNPPGADLPGFCSNVGSTDQVDSALGVTGFLLTGDDEGLADAESYTQLPGIYTQCDWGDDGSGTQKFSYLSVAMLKGGAWVLPQLVGESDSSQYLLPAYAPVTIAGADGAVISCSSAAQSCIAYFAIGSVLVNVSMSDPGPTAVDAALTKIVADIQAS